jgi:hypothetical protein
MNWMSGGLLPRGRRWDSAELTAQGRGPAARHWVTSSWIRDGSKASATEP